MKPPLKIYGGIQTHHLDPFFALSPVLKFDLLANSTNTQQKVSRSCRTNSNPIVGIHVLTGGTWRLLVGGHSKAWSTEVHVGASGSMRGRGAGGVAGARAGAVGGPSLRATWRSVIRGCYPPVLTGTGNAVAPGRACTRSPVFGTRVKRGWIRALVRRESGAQIVRLNVSSARFLGPKVYFVLFRVEPINRPLRASFFYFSLLFL